MAYKQSDLDGLCGVFSVINAIDHFHGLSYDEAKDLFKFIIEESDVQNVTTQGSYVKDLKRFLKCAVDWFHEQELPPIEWKQPFLKKKLKTGQEWIEHLKPLLTDHSGIIIGIEEPLPHWTVVSEISPKYLKLSDSGSWDRFARDAIYTIDEVKPDDGEYLVIWPHQVFVIRLKQKRVFRQLGRQSVDIAP